MRSCRQILYWVLFALISTSPLVATAAEEVDEPWLIRVSREKADREREIAKVPPTASDFTHMKAGRNLRIESPGSTLHGPFERFAADTLWLRSADAERSVPIASDSIRSVWIRGNGSGKGAVIGGTIGAVLSLAMAGVIVAEVEGETNAGGFVAMGALGFAGGAMIGALFGSSQERWHRHYP